MGVTAPLHRVTIDFDDHTVLFLPSLNRRLQFAVTISLLRDFKNDTATETRVHSARDETAALSRSENVAR